MWDYLPLDANTGVQVNTYDQLVQVVPDTSHGSYNSFTMKGNIDQIDEANAFLARLVNEAYAPVSEREDYIEHINGDLYKKLTFNATFDDYCAVYEPFSNLAIDNNKETYFAIRGSQTMYDAYVDLLQAANTIPFLTSYVTDVITFGGTSFLGLCNTIKAQVDAYTASNPDRLVVLCGHSLGSAIASAVFRRCYVDDSNYVRLTKCVCFNGYYVPDSSFTQQYLECLTPTTDGMTYFKQRVHHHIIGTNDGTGGDPASVLLLSRGFGNVNVYDPVITNTHANWIDTFVSPEVGYNAYSLYENHRIVNFTKTKHYPDPVLVHEFDAQLLNGHKIALETLNHKVVTSYSGDAYTHGLKLVRPLDGTADMKLHLQYGTGAPTRTDYEWVITRQPNFYYIYEMGGSKYFSRKYTLTTNTPGETFSKNVWFQHASNVLTEERHVYIITAQTGNNNVGQYVYQIKSTADWDVAGLFPWTMISPLPTNNKDASTGFFKDGRTQTYLNRGIFMIWYDAEIGQDAAWPDHGQRRIFDTSLYTTPAPVASVGAEIEHGKTYKIFSANSEYRTSVGSTSGNDIFLRRIACEIGTTWGYNAGTTLGDSKLCMCVATSTTGLNDEWYCERVNGSADIKLTCNGTQLKVGLMPVNDLGDTYPDVTINGNMYLTADASAIYTDNLANPSSGFKSYSIRGLATNGNLVMAESRSFYWSSPTRDPVVPAIMPTPPAAPYSGTTGAQYWIFEEVVASGIP